jgi:hypothetical protein
MFGDSALKAPAIGGAAGAALGLAIVLADRLLKGITLRVFLLRPLAC